LLALSGISSKRGDYFCCKRYENNKSHTQNKHSESLRCKYRKRQTKAFAQPEADSEERAIPPDRFEESSLGQRFSK